ncbi:MAG: gfo/Idh/MocA family oxidoreductase [Leptolyngbya sp. PLA3]|nr:MAG: gfo/Idh/MocA family oxidoreductase [Cyanobacteria bacterium CYA]MCE7967603.1 gfo/Idh/MocA family oxidoreductase [Leptolyngbya sp. PL-A3]
MDPVWGEQCPMSALRWIVMGTGLIADKVTPLLARAPGCRVVGAASRDLGRARAFAERHGLEQAHTYEELVGGAPSSEDRSQKHADAVYCTLPNRQHPEWALRLLEAGFHVLCEKPLCWRRADAEQLFQAAERAGRLLVEGFMYLHHPQIEALATIARDGEGLGVSPVGPIRRIEAFFESDMKAVGREATRYSHVLAGGATLDLGCYPISFVRTVLGRELGEMKISGVVAGPIAGESRGVDERIEVEGDAEGASFRLSFGIDRTGSRAVRLIGEHGTVGTEWPWSPDAERAELTVERAETHPRGAGRETIVIAKGGDKFVNQFGAFAAAVRGGRAARPSAAWSIDQAEAIERVLAGVGVEFGRGL